MTYGHGSTLCTVRQHRVAGVSEENNLVRFVDPGIERETIAQRPLERARHHLQQLLNTTPYKLIDTFIEMK